MSLADTLIDGLSEEDIAAYSVDAERHIVIGKDRHITVPEELKRIAVQHDHNVETATFDCPRYWDEHDMSVMNIGINFRCPDGTVGTYLVDDVVVDENNGSIIHFTWTISNQITKVPGKLAFLVCITEANAAGYETVHWNSELCEDMYVSKGLETGVRT